MKNKILSFILPIICGLTVANMYYVQSIFPEVMHALDINYQSTAMIYTMSLIGNACSLVFIAPLGDFINRKKLISFLYIILAIASIGASLSLNIYEMYIAAFFLGVGVAIIPITISYLSKNENFGLSYIGKIMSGVLLGALISRFLSSEFATIWGWNSIYIFSFSVMLFSLIVVALMLPNDQVEKTKEIGYGKMLGSTFSLLISNRTVRKYSLYGFLVMAVFASFWNNISFSLFDDYHLTQTNVGLFSLTGIAGASAAMFASSILRKLNYDSISLFVLMFISFAVLAVINYNLIALIIGSVVIDAMIQLIHVNNQTNMYKNCEGNESRAASCYMTTFIFGGVVGSKVSSICYISYGWQGICVMCACIAIICLVPFKEQSAENNVKLTH